MHSTSSIIHCVILNIDITRPKTLDMILSCRILLKSIGEHSLFGSISF